MTATETLYRRGAHFVLTGALNDPKRPLWRAWQAPKCGRPSLEVVNAHLAQRRPLGLIPWSLHETVVDIDAGDPDAWVRDNPPRLAVPSRRPEGRHCYYDDTRPQPRRKFAFGELAGEYIGARAFVVLWHDTADRLAGALERAGRFPFPRDLFEAAGLRARAAGAEAQPSRGVAAGVCEGERGTTLFNTVRRWAYSHVRLFDDLDAWSSECRRRASAINDSFPEPIGSLPGDRADDVHSTAWSVASWCWARRDKFGANLRCADPVVLQARRRKGGIVNARRRRAAVRDRDRDIVAMLDKKKSLRRPP